jgi:NAD(P)-dependent dehydrogenase (short-subunit alcohol dehydrogenase family)
MSVAGRTALVVGAGGGIGTALMDRSAREGARVYASDLSIPNGEADGVRRLVRDSRSRCRLAGLRRRVVGHRPELHDRRLTAASPLRPDCS